jgi:Zn finger protein HypA/HybF involved in hydrogenase expression
VAPGAIRFCFDLTAQGTPVQGAELEIFELSATRGDGLEAWCAWLRERTVSAAAPHREM